MSGINISVNDLTLEEKLRLLTGKNTWQTSDLGGKLPSLFLSDGPNGLRKLKNPEVPDGNKETVPATAFPSAVTIANSWDVDVAKEVAGAIAQECALNDVDINLGPGCNIKRTPLCGRNFEYYSEDPLVAGLMAKAYIEGVQQSGIGATLKHFCLNNREYSRTMQSSEADERTLFEIYLKPFEIALKARPLAVMSSYNPVNGVYASENKKFLKDILRNKFGHNGIIVSDWGAVRDRAKSLKATLDLDMPYSEKSFENLKAAYERGFISVEEIDECVRRMLDLINEIEELKSLRPKSNQIKCHEVAKKATLQGIVLLKNEDDILPLKAGKICVIGSMSVTPAYGGGGSSFVKTIHTIPPLHELIKENTGAQVKFERGYQYGGVSTMQKPALKSAYESDAVILVVGSRPDEESEFFDRASIRLRPSL